MNQRLKTPLRTGQIYLPGGSDTKYVLQRTVRRALKRPCEPEFTALCHLTLRKESILVDAGANRSQSIDAMRLTAADREIASFEPNPLLAGRLQREYGASADVTIHPLALSDREQSFTPFAPSDRGYLFDGASSLSEKEAKQWLVGRIHRLNPALLTEENWALGQTRGRA